VVCKKHADYFSVLVMYFCLELVIIALMQGRPFAFLPFSLRPLPLNTSRRSRECCKLPQRVWAEPSHQMHFGALWGKVKHFRVLMSCIV